MEHSYWKRHSWSFIRNLTSHIHANWRIMSSIRCRIRRQISSTPMIMLYTMTTKWSFICQNYRSSNGKTKSFKFLYGRLRSSTWNTREFPVFINKAVIDPWPHEIQTIFGNVFTCIDDVMLKLTFWGSKVLVAASALMDVVRPLAPRLWIAFCRSKKQGTNP